MSCTLADVAPALVAGLREADVCRLLIVGGAGSLEVAPGKRLVDTPDFPGQWKPEAIAQSDALDYYRGVEDLEWTFVTPQRLGVIDRCERGVGSWPFAAPTGGEIVSESSVAQYALGYRDQEQERLGRQAAELAPEAEELFDAIGVDAGARVVELGCGPRGCLEQLSRRVGPAGSVVGVEVSEQSVALARAIVEEAGLGNVEVRAGDARSTGLAEGSFDLVTVRLVLVNVPRPQEIIAEALRLARPGGAVAFHEIDWAAFMCDPPLKAWDQAIDLFAAIAGGGGANYYIGRQLARLLREGGAVEVSVRPIMHAYPPGNPRRTLLLDFAGNFEQRAIEQGLITAPEFTALKANLARHIADPATTVFVGPYVQAWGRRRG